MSIKDKPDFFYPVLRYDFGEASVLSPEEISSLYDAAIDSVIAAFARLNLAKDIIPNIELTLSSDAFYENLIKLLRKYMGYKPKDRLIKISIGTVINKQDIEDLIYLLKPYIEDIQEKQKIEIFSPCFNKQVYELINIFNAENSSKLEMEYIPGVFNSNDFNKLKAEMPELQKLKIFPATAKSAKDLKSFAKGPFLELRKARNDKRFIVISDDLKDKYPLDPEALAQNGVQIINSLTDYLKLRDSFLVNENMKLVLSEPNTDTSNLYAADLIRDIDQKHPKIEIYATGIKDLESDTNLKTLLNKGINHVGTSVFKYIILDILSGAINFDEAKKQMQEEIYSLYMLFELI